MSEITLKDFHGEGVFRDSAGQIWMTLPQAMNACAQAWDAAIRSMKYEDGTPVEVISTVNPYRVAPVTEEGDKDAATHQ